MPARGERRPEAQTFLCKTPFPRAGSMGAPPLLLLNKTVGALNAKVRRAGGALRCFKKGVGGLAIVITAPPEEAASFEPCRAPLRPPNRALRRSS